MLLGMSGRFVMCGWEFCRSDPRISTPILWNLGRDILLLDSLCGRVCMVRENTQKSFEPYKKNFLNIYSMNTTLLIQTVRNILLTSDVVAEQV